MDKVKFGTVMRGDGKVFVRVLPPARMGELGATGAWRSHAQATDGRTLPSRIVALEAGEVVLVVPILAVDYAVRVELLAKEGGAVLAAGTFKLRQGLCKLQGQFNTLRKNTEAEHIRNCDREWRAQEARITDVRILYKNAEADILRFFVTQRMRDGRIPKHAVSVVTPDGRSIAGDKFVKIGETSYDNPDYPGISHHRVAYSVEIPAGSGDFFIWAQDQSGSEASTIDCVWRRRADALREDWRRLTLPAEFEILVVADGAAFGPEMDKLYEISRRRNLSLFLPESFEWLILRSGIVRRADIPEVLASPAEHVESSEFFNWERFFTAYLIEVAGTGPLQYSKRHLNKAYLSGKNMEKIIAAAKDDVDSE